MIEIAPHAVDVIRVILRVVILEDEVPALHAIVMRLAQLESTRPRKVNLVQPSLLDLREVFRRHIRAAAEKVFLDHFHQRRLLVRREFVLRDAFGIRRIDPLRIVQNFLRRFHHDDRFLPLFVRERFYERPPEVFFRPEDARPLARPDADLAGIRPEKRRRHRRRAVVGRREIQRKVMPLHAPTPRALPRRPKDRNEITFRIAQRRAGFPFLHFGQHCLQTHDRDCLAVSAMTQPRRQQRLGKQPLLLRHFLDRQTLSLARDEVPVRPLRIREIKRDLRLLIRRQGDEKIVCRGSHFGTGFVGAQRVGSERKGEEGSQETFHRMGRHEIHGMLRKETPA